MCIDGLKKKMSWSISLIFTDVEYKYGEARFQRHSDNIDDSLNLDRGGILLYSASPIRIVK